MIIITGPGRSGTSFLAKLYLELGFDPGGTWFTEVNAGLEAEPVVQVNRAIAKDLGVHILGPLRDPPAPLSRLGKRIVPHRARPTLRAILSHAPWMYTEKPTFMQWEKLERVVEKHRTTLHELSGTYQVVKDPQFCWTLRVWAAAGAKIDHVIVSTRSLDAMAQSRAAVDHLRFRSQEAAKNSFSYGLGLCLTTLCDYRIPYSIVRFPDFLEQPDALFESLAFPAETSLEQFREAFARVRRPDLVHDPR